MTQKQLSKFFKAIKDHPKEMLLVIACHVRDVYYVEESLFEAGMLKNEKNGNLYIITHPQASLSHFKSFFGRTYKKKCIILLFPKWWKNTQPEIIDFVDYVVDTIEGIK